MATATLLNLARRMHAGLLLLTSSVVRCSAYRLSTHIGECTGAPTLDLMAHISHSVTPP
jgi:hypothetical protein